MTTTPQSDNQILKVLFISILIDLFGFTSILPIYPSIFAHYETNDKSDAYTTIFSSVQYFRKNIINAPDSINELKRVLKIIYLNCLNCFSTVEFMSVVI